MQIFKAAHEVWHGFQLRISGKLGIFTHSNTADRTYTVPDKSGTVCLTSDFNSTNIINGLGYTPAPTYNPTFTGTVNGVNGIFSGTFRSTLFFSNEKNNALFRGNWNASDFWGIGPDSSISSNTIKIGACDANGVWLNGSPNLVIGSNNYTILHTGNTSNFCTLDTDQKFLSTKTFTVAPYYGWSKTDISNTSRGPLTMIYAAIAASKPLFTDEEFSIGNNSVTVYNNSGGSAVTITREANSDAPNTSGYVLKVVYDDTVTPVPSPGLGGFVQQYMHRKNAIIIQRFRAKLPIGFSFKNAENATGYGSGVTWLTSKEGTGKWEEYIRLVSCGDSGTFSTGGHVCVLGTGPYTFYLASCNAYELNTGGLVDFLQNGGTFGGPVTQPRIVINRESNIASGIKWYKSAYKAWQEYMSNPVAGAGFDGDITVPSGVDVTSWAHHSYIENTTGYGWVWESASSATSLTPSIVAELSSNNGNFRTIGQFFGTQFNGSGAGLTGTAASLTAGDSNKLSGKSLDTIPYAYIGAGSSYGTVNSFTTDGGPGANALNRSCFFRDNNGQFGTLGVHIQHATSVDYALQIASTAYDLSSGTLQARSKVGGVWGTPITLWANTNFDPSLKYDKTGGNINGNVISLNGFFSVRQSSTTQYSQAMFTWENVAAAAGKQKVNAFLQNNVEGGGGSSYFIFRHEHPGIGTNYTDIIKYSMDPLSGNIYFAGNNGNMYFNNNVIYHAGNSHKSTHAPGGTDSVFPANAIGKLVNDGNGNLSWDNFAPRKTYVCTANVSTNAYLRLATIPINAEHKNVQVNIKAVTAAGTTTELTAFINLAYYSGSYTAEYPSVITNVSHSCSTDTTAENGWVLQYVRVSFDGTNAYLDVRKNKAGDITLYVTPLIKNDWEWASGVITSESAAGSYRSVVSYLYHGLSGYNITANSAGSSSYSNYGILYGRTLSNVTDKTGLWEQFGYLVIDYNSSYLKGRSINSEIRLKEHANSGNPIDLEDFIVKIKSILPLHANSTEFNTLVPGISLEVEGNTSLTSNDFAALVYSTSATQKIIRVYVKLKAANTHYDILPINRYGESFDNNLTPTTSYSLFNGAASIATIASLPTPAQGSIVYGVVNKIKSYNTLHYYYDVVSTTNKQPVHHAQAPGTITKVTYYRDNTTAPTSNGTIVIKKGGTVIYTITIATTDASQTRITVSTTPTNFSTDDKIEAVVTNAGVGCADITVQVDIERYTNK